MRSPINTSNHEVSTHEAFAATAHTMYIVRCISLLGKARFVKRSNSRFTSLLDAPRRSRLSEPRFFAIVDMPRLMRAWLSVVDKANPCRTQHRNALIAAPIDAVYEEATGRPPRSRKDSIASTVKRRPIATSSQNGNHGTRA